LDDNPVSLSAWIARVGGFLQVARFECVGVDDEHAALLEVGEIDLERRRIHRHEDVGLVARRLDVLAAEVDLKRADARQSAGGCTDLGRKIGQRVEVVADGGGGGGEAIAGDLHAVAGITGEPDHDPVQALDASRRRRFAVHGVHRLLT
jgi:hypothetical protein